MRCKKLLVLTFILLIIIFKSIGYPFWDTLKSYGVMYIYDRHIVKNSYLSKENIVFDIPGGNFTSKKDWYPFMLHHDASSDFSKYVRRDLKTMILYSFGSFDFMKGSSNFYNPSSPYQGAFYGGYALFDNNTAIHPFGFNADMTLNFEEIQSLPLFDQTRLVLSSLGCPPDKIIFENAVTSIENHVPYIGMMDWTKINAIITTNAPTHTYNGKKNIGYLQYGKPHKKFSSVEDFPIITLHGRIYIKYIQELNGTFILYIMAKDQKIIDDTDKSILSHTKIKKL